MSTTDVHVVQVAQSGFVCLHMNRDTRYIVHKKSLRKGIRYCVVLPGEMWLMGRHE